MKHDLDIIAKEFQQAADHLEAIGRAATAACRNLVDAMKRIQPREPKIRGRKGKL